MTENRYPTEGKNEISVEDNIEIIKSFEKLIRESDSEHDLVWNVVEHINVTLGYVDCVIYLYSQTRNCLVQVAACGNTKVEHRKLKNPIYIEPGEGIVGRVFQFGKARIIDDTTKDANYIIDDRFRLSEISVPIRFNSQIIGVLDSEHPEENYYSQADLVLLTEIAQLLAQKLNELNSSNPFN